MRYWTQSMGEFVPSFFTQEKHGDVCITSLDNSDLIDTIVKDHMTRSPLPREETDYQCEDFSDEIRIYVKSGKRWRTLLNIQLDGVD